MSRITFSGSFCKQCRNQEKRIKNKDKDIVENRIVWKEANFIPDAVYKNIQRSNNPQKQNNVGNYPRIFCPHNFWIMKDKCKKSEHPRYGACMRAMRPLQKKR